jgi:hypothetical protein
MTKPYTNEALDIKLQYVKSDLEEVKTDVKYVKENFITRREFEEFQQQFLLVRNGFFGMIMFIVTGFLGVVVNFFIRKQ